jgi:predicted GNAT family acetyltransferase
VRVRVEDDSERDRYVVYADDARAGYTAYRRVPGKIALDHTEIDERFEGEGVGSALARHVLDEARESGLEVLPFCPFVRSWIERHPDYVELIPAEQRERFGFGPDGADQPS